MYIAHVKTEACDEYDFTFDELPTRDEVNRQVWECEGGCEEFEFYQATTQITIRSA